MLLQLDFSHEEPIYKQIRDQIVLGIASGGLKTGDRLPAIRALAKEIGVNVMTVNKSYQALKQEGYIAADRRGGTVVARRTPGVPDDAIIAELMLPAATAKLSGVTREEWLGLCGLAFEKISEERGENQ